MNSTQIKALREAGNFQAAIEQGLPYLSDFKILIQVNWAYYGLIKQQITQVNASLKQSTKPSFHLIKSVYDTVRAYSKLPNRRADSSLSNILRELSKIAAYSPDYLKFIYWVSRINGFQNSDWEVVSYQGKHYSPLVCNVARSLARYANAFPQQTNSEDLNYIIGWLENTRSVAEEDDKLWLDWDRVKLLKRLGRHTEAAQILSFVLKAKRNDFWVWQEAGRLYAYEQPELARACYCRALECKAKPEFTVNVHMELAQLLAVQNEAAWATAEVLAALDIRQKQNWKINDELQKMMNESWYNPAIELPDRIYLYDLYAPDALILCFDNIYEQPANFVELFKSFSSKKTNQRISKTLAKFIVQDNKGKAIFLVAADDKILSTWKPGTPALLTIGSTEDIPKTVMHITPRLDGQLWDCVNQETGLVQDIKEDCLWFFLNRDKQIRIPLKNWHGKSPQIGKNAVLFIATNLRKNRIEILFAHGCEDREMKDVKRISGDLRRNEKGFAFVEDIFISPNLLSTIESDIQQVKVIAVYAKNPKKLEYGWRAIGFLT